MDINKWGALQLYSMTLIGMHDMNTWLYTLCTGQSEVHINIM